MEEGRPEARRWEVLPELNRRAAVQLLSVLMSRVLTSPSVAAAGGGDGGAAARARVGQGAGPTP